MKIPMPTAQPSLADFFINQLIHAGAMSKDELRLAAEAAGYFEPGGGGRSTHATLENIKRSGRVIFGDDGKYTVNTMEKALL